MEASTAIYRAATASDYLSIAVLHTASWRRAYRGILPDSYLDGSIAAEREQLWQRRFAQPNGRQYVVLAEHQQTLLGFACVLLDEEPNWGACLDNLHVHPQARGSGIGGQLLYRAAQWVVATVPGWPMHLWVFEANKRARGFYERYGGVPVEHAAHQMPGGVAPAILRYLWRDPNVIRQTPAQA